MDPFCDSSILEGAFYTTDNTMALYDAAPVVPGHSLIIPRRHVPDIIMLTDEEMLDMLETVKKIGPVIFSLYGDGSGSYDLTAQIGKYSGMTIEHLHMHFIPRRKDDDYQGSSDVYGQIEKAERLGKEEYMNEVKRLREEMERQYGSKENGQ